MSRRLFSRERKTSLLRFSLFSSGLTYAAGDLRLIHLLDFIYLLILCSFPLSALLHRGGTFPQPLGSFTTATSTGSSEAKIEAGDRRALPVEKSPGVKGRTLILLDVNTKSPVRIISENFLSLQLDPSIIHDGWLDFLSSRRLVTLARGLAPAFLRFAGKRTDFLQFHNVKNPAKSRGGPGPDYYLKNYEDDIVRSDIALDKQKGCKIAQHPDIMLELQREKAAQMHLVLLKEQFSNTYSNLTLTARSLDKLYNFADCSGLHLIFALNALRRNPNNSWNSSNALSLLKYSASKKYNISWELGNEPNNYRTLIGRSVNGSQLGKDYIQLRSLLQLIRTYSRANLYGPNIGRPRKNVMALLEGFMKVAGSTVDAVTWQHYYIDGRVAKVTDFLKTRLLDTLSDQIRKIQKVVNTYTPGKKIWLEGVGATSAGGMNNLSDSYAAGFLWLNTLGLLASQGIDVVVRHSFLDHGHNHLVDQNFNPLPGQPAARLKQVPIAATAVKEWGEMMRSTVTAGRKRSSAAKAMQSQAETSAAAEDCRVQEPPLGRAWCWCCTMQGLCCPGGCCCQSFVRDLDQKAMNCPRSTTRSRVMLRTASAQPCWRNDQPRLEQDAWTSAGTEPWMLKIL
ncbi:inactive heparanase-2 isoform X2 [Coturnix japonica]|uniref:inactive heparanase-2 isoform X2 n=1 Tax=Coturnix japonica TaxID=93934 RepID=UPI000776E277|nr:inactive heparanase-2 isoform X2 [Coturnix japonica]